MENKPLFLIITLSVTLIVGFFFYSNKVAELENAFSATTNEPDSKVSRAENSTTNNDDASHSALTLDDLDQQIIMLQSELTATKKALSLANSKSYVLSDEISKIEDARSEVDNLKGSLQSTQQSLNQTQDLLKISDKKLNHLKNVFEQQNQSIVKRNFERISALKETSTGIAVTGVIVPVIGVATLVSYTVEEIENYCQNIKNTMSLEKKVLGEIVSLDEQMQKNYHTQCVVSLKDKVKETIKDIQIAQ